MINIVPNARFTDLDEDKISVAIEKSPLGYQFFEEGGDIQKYLAVHLGVVWQGCVARLNDTHFVKKLNAGQLTTEDYKILLINLRRQMIEGSRWIIKTAASMESEYSDVCNDLIDYAVAPYHDYQKLEKAYINLGGDRREITTRFQDVGVKDFTAYMYRGFGRHNPLQLFGAMFIIESLVVSFTSKWGGMIQEQTGINNEDNIFLIYTGENNGHYFEKLKSFLSLPQITEDIADDIIHAAKVVARLYCLQLEG